HYRLAGSRTERLTGTAQLFLLHLLQYLLLPKAKPETMRVPTAHWAQGQNLKMVPAPKPLPPRGAGPGGTSPHDGALQHEEGPHLPVDSKTKFGGIGASGYIPPDPNIAVGKTGSNGLGYIVQVVNSQMAVFNKSGSLLP